MKKKVSIILPYYNRLKLLEKTLKSFNFLYKKNNLEIVIVDDVSNIDNDPTKLKNKFKSLDLKIIKLKNKTGINPCYPYNVGVKNSTGDILILSSPETFHINNIFTLTNNFENLNDNNYFLFSVFCLTDKTITEKINNLNKQNEIINLIKSEEINFHKNLGEFGYSFNNKYGSWFLHPTYRRTGLNFLTAIKRDLFYDISGFDERFRFGTGYDDDEFRDRLIERNIDFIYYENLVGIHVDHEIVNNENPTTNDNIYNDSKINKYKKNDLWGLM